MRLTGLGVIPAILGFLIVCQAGLNRKIAAQWGLPAAAFLNSTVLWTSTALLLSLAVFHPSILPSGFQFQWGAQGFKFWYVLPGLFGLTLILGAPWCIARWGATYTFVLLISSQVVASILWDLKVENLSISRQRLVGAGLAWIGVLFASWGKK